MTEPGGPAWRQTTFFPFAITSRLAVGDGARGQARRSDTYATDRLRRGPAGRRRRHPRRRRRARRRSSWSTAALDRGRPPSRVDVSHLGDGRRRSRPTPWPTTTSTRRTPSPTRTGSASRPNTERRRRRRPPHRRAAARLVDGRRPRMSHRPPATVDVGLGPAGHARTPATCSATSSSTSTARSTAASSSPARRSATSRASGTDVVEALRELAPPVVRWPGGCFVSSYHWLDGVGPDRRPTYDMAWRVTDPNTFGTAEFVAWCRAIGAEPYICTNAGTGTAEEMSDWVEYCNLPADQRPLGRPARRARLGRAVRRAVLEHRQRELRRLGDGRQDRGRVGEPGPRVGQDDPPRRRGPRAADGGPGRPGLDAAAARRRRPAPRPDLDPRLLGRAQPGRRAVGLPHRGRPLPRPAGRHRARAGIIGATGLGDRVGIAFDEWNLRGWHHPVGNAPEAIAARDANDVNATYTMADALFTASFLNACLRHADVVRMANIAPTVNTRGPLFVHPDGARAPHDVPRAGDVRDAARRAGAAQHRDQRRTRPSPTSR